MSAASPTSAGGGLFRGEPAYEAHTPWGAAAGLAGAVAIVLLSMVGAPLLPRLLGLGDILGDLPGPPGGHGGEASSLRVVAIWQALMVALTLLASALFGGRIRDVLALRETPYGWRSYATALVAMAALQLVLTAVQHSLLRHDMLTDLRQFINLVRGPEWLVTAAVVGLGAPFSEELLFRGFLLSALARTRLGFWGAAVITSLLWTAMHVGYSAVGLAEVLLIGLFLSWLLWRTGSLRVAIFCHAAYNSLILLALRLVDLSALV
jgi:CAAX protease family protein